MRRHVILMASLIGLMAPPCAYAEAQSLQDQYLKIYLRINEADQYERQGDYRAALDNFKDCYQRLQKIHQNNPDWESALVVQRMRDCKREIDVLTDKAAAQAPAPPPIPAQPVVTPVPSPTAPDVTNAAPANATTDTDDPVELKRRLAQMQRELADLKARYANTQLENQTLHAQLDAVNQQLTALKSQQSIDDRVGQLMAQNQQLTSKLSDAQKQLQALTSGPKSSAALLRAQLKTAQDKLVESEAANTALQQTTSVLRQQLDQAQSDLNAANQRLASVPAVSPEYATLKHENELMRGILQREIQEQSRRDGAKRLEQEEFDRLKITSKVMQEQLDILGSPMTPPANDEERALLASLKGGEPSLQTAPEDANHFSAPASGTAAPTNVAAATAPDPAPISTPAPTPTPTDNSTAAPVTITPTTAPTDTSTGASAPTNAPVAAASSGSASSPADSTAPTNAAAAVPPATTPIPPAPDAGGTSSTTTITTLPPADTTITDTTISHGTATANPPPPPAAPTATTPPAAAPAKSPTKIAARPTLPDDARDTAKEAAALFKQGRYDDAVAKYQTILEKYPDSLYAWSNLGVVRFQQGNLPEALKALQQAVKLSPTDAFSYSNLGIVYYQMGQYESAIEALERALALDPNDAKSHNYLGCSCSQKGWQEVAEREFRKAIEIDDTFGDAHFNLALVYATSKPPSLELARRHYSRALELGIAKDPRLEKLLSQ